MQKAVFKSITFKILASVILVVLPINLLLIICSTALIDASRKELIKESENSLQIYLDKLEREISDTDQYLVKLKTNENYLKILKNQFGDDQYEYVRTQTKVLNEMSDYLEMKDLVSGMVIVLNEQNLMMRREKSSSVDANLDEVFKLETVEDIQWKICHLNSEWYILRSVKSELSTIYTWINLSDACAYFDNVENNKGNILLINQQTGIIVGGQNLEEGTINVKAMSDIYPITIARQLHKDELKLLPGFIFILEILSAITIVAIPILIFQLRKQVIIPISGLTKAIHRIKEGNLEYRIEISHVSNEFDQINESFNDMMNEIKNLKVNVYEEKIEKKNIQLEYLSHQIQPHFVLNTLNILYCYNQDEYPLMLNMIKNLMNYFRYIVKVNSFYVTVEQELDHIRNYLEIQKVRYPEHFYYYIESEESVKKSLIPPLCIQNFVENSIKNAVSLDYNIDIYVLIEEVKEHNLRIRIADTGKGFEEEILEEIDKFIATHETQPHLGIGLQNAIMRLDILYEHVPEIRIYNSISGGATVDIILPIHMEEKIDV